MNKRPIAQSTDRDLRLSEVALQRATQRAREVAAAAGTALVINHNGVIEHLTPKPPGNHTPED